MTVWKRFKTFLLTTKTFFNIMITCSVIFNIVYTTHTFELPMDLTMDLPMEAVDH